MSSPVKLSSSFNSSTGVRSPQVFVVEASAGAGKTYALAKRYVQLIFNSPPQMEGLYLRSILAITFTNKAAFEMKDRIFEFVKKIALQKFSPDELFSLLSSSPEKQEQVTQKAFAVIDELLGNYNFFQVQTIDSFINTLLSGCSFKLGLSANFKIKTDYRKNLELSLDRLIDQAQHENILREVLEKFLHQYLFLENRTSWFPKKDILITMNALFSQSNILGYGYRNNPSSATKVFKLKKNIFTLIKKLQENLPQGVDGRFEKSLISFLFKSSDGFNVENVSDYFLREEFPIKKDSNEVPHLVDDLWHQIREQLKIMSELESVSVFDAYIEIYQRILSDFKATAIKEDILFLEELNNKTRLLYDEQGLSVEELYYRLATKFRHYLVDEFQDTSILQWKNLVLMIEEALSTGGTLFYVGDKKQAIYGFRGGEVELFDAVRDRFRIFGTSLESLDRNFRSQKQIVEFNNNIFSKENLLNFIERKETFENERKKKNAVYLTSEEKMDVLQVFHNSVQSSLSEKSGGYVKVELIGLENKEEREQYVQDQFISIIENLRQRFLLQDIACLARDNQEVGKITHWLLAHGISADSERTSSIRENFLIKELISFLRFLDSPIDNLNFASFILGEIFTSRTEFNTEKVSQFIFSFRGRISKEKDFYLYKEFRDRYPHLWEKYFEEFFQNVGFYPLYELVLSILRKFDVAKNFLSDQGYLMRFLELIKEQEIENTDISSFIEYFDTAKAEDLYVNVTDADTVKVLTIHKAKGLEFPVVIIPFLDMDLQIGSSGGQGARPYVVSVQDESLQLVHLKQKHIAFSESLGELYRSEYKKALLSELNAVYVALTRAIYEMYLFVPPKAGNSFNLARFLFPEHSLERGVQVASSSLQKNTQNILKVPCSVYCDWIDFLKDEFVDISEIQLRENMRKGELIHSVLARIDLTNPEWEEQNIQEALEMIVTDQLSSTDLVWFKKKISDIITAKDLRPFWGDAGDKILLETSVVTTDGQTRRFDRLIVKDQEVWIVDYKSHRDLSGIQQTQIKEYMHIVKKLYPQKGIRGFLVYIDDVSFKEILSE